MIWLFMLFSSQPLPVPFFSSLPKNEACSSSSPFSDVLFKPFSSPFLERRNVVPPPRALLSPPPPFFFPLYFPGENKQAGQHPFFFLCAMPFPLGVRLCLSPFSQRWMKIAPPFLSSSPSFQLFPVSPLFSLENRGDPPFSFPFSR